MKTELWWASVGGNKTCEPIRVTGGNDAKQFFSIGCGDPHPMDGVELVEKIEPDNVPLTAAQRKRREQAFERRIAREEAQGIVRSYRRFE